MSVNALRFLRRFQVPHPTRSVSVIYSSHGPPQDVLRLESADFQEKFASSIRPKEVRLRLLAAPINPADINMIQGTYPIKPCLPAVGGNEGVFEVIEIGSNCNRFKPGDRALPAQAGWGTWRCYASCSEEDLQLVPSDIPVVAAATLTVNPSTAYRMLEDYKELCEGDVVIQNSANSGVGQAVIQIAAARKLRTINIIRDRPNLSEVSDQLKLMGATEVVTEEFAQSYRMKSVIEQMGEPTLALNGVGGKSSLTLLRLLADGGTMVTYGGMSRQPITVPTGSLIFNDKSIQGFWMTRWSKSSTQSDRQKMLNSLYEYIRSGSLKTVLHGTWKLQDFHAAVTEAMQPFHAKKQIFINKT